MSLPSERAEGFDYEADRLYNHRFGDEFQDPGPEVVPVAFARELEEENQKMKAALSQIFAWWDAADGKLVTHYPSAVTPKMREFRSLSNDQGEGRRKGGSDAN